MDVASLFHGTFPKTNMFNSLSRRRHWHINDRLVDPFRDQILCLEVFHVRFVGERHLLAVAWAHPLDNARNKHVQTVRRPIGNTFKWRQI